MIATRKRRRRETMPTPEQIREATAKIRSGWTPEIRKARRQMAIVNQQRLSFLSQRSAA